MDTIFTNRISSLTINKTAQNLDDILERQELEEIQNISGIQNSDPETEINQMIQECEDIREKSKKMDLPEVARSMDDCIIHLRMQLQREQGYMV